MKFKTIVFFVLGLFGWLFATNYQSVYSKMTNFINPQSETVLASASISETSITSDSNENQSKAKIDDIDTSSDDIKHESEVIENHETDEISETTTEEIQVANLEDEIVEDEESSNEVQTTADESSHTEEDENQSLEIGYVEQQIPTQYHMTGYPMMNPNMMNPAMYMNPMAMMTPMMMTMMTQMMNPAVYMNPLTTMNYPVDTMTQAPNMNAMMMAMNPEMMFGMFGQPSEAYKKGEVPDQLPVITVPGMPTQNFQNWPKNTVSPEISREAKHNAFQTAMAMSPLSMRNMVSMMADKIPVEEGVTWDDAVEAMKLRANEVNFKFVGSSPLWKQIEAETEKPSAKVEMFRFCDARMARKILDEVPEFIVFLPCKIALLEDAEGKLWVMTLDWDVSWMDYAQNPNNHLSKDIREHAKLIRENIQYIMEGAATGDF